MLKLSALAKLARTGLVGLAATAAAASSMTVVSVVTAAPASAAVDCSVRSGTRPDLSGCSLQGVDLSTATWTLPNLTGADLAGAKIGNALKNGAVIDGTDFTGADLTGAWLKNLTFKNAYLIEVKINSSTDFTGATFPGTVTKNIDWSAMTKNAAGQATLGGKDSWYDGATPSQSDHVTIADEGGCTNGSQKCGVLIGPGASLNGINISGMDLENANLSGVASGNPATTGTPAKANGRYKLVGGYLMGLKSDLSYANLRNLDLTGVDLSQAVFTYVKSSGLKGSPKLASDAAILNGVLFAKGVDLAGVDVKNLDLSSVSLVGVSSGGIKNSPAALPAGYQLAKGYLIGPGVNLAGATLTDVNLMNVNLTNASLFNATLTGVTLYNNTFTGVNASGLKSSGIRLLPGTANVFAGLGAVLNGYIVGKGVSLPNADLRNTVASGLDLSGIDLSEAQLSGARWTAITTPSADPTLPPRYGFRSCKISNGSTTGCLVGPGVNLAPQQALGMTPNSSLITLTGDLSAIDFTGADLTTVSSTAVTANDTTTWPPGTKVINGTIVGPYMRATGADLSGADLTGVDMTGFFLTNGKFQNYTNTTGLKLDNAIFNGTDMTGTNLTGASKAGLKAANLTGTAPTITTAGWVAATASSKTTLVGPGANLVAVPLAGLDISGADLTGAKTFALGSAAAKLPTNYKAVTCSTEATAGNSCIVGPGVDLSGYSYLPGWPTMRVSVTSTALDGPLDLTGAKLDGLKGSGLSCASSPTFPTGVKCAPTAFGPTARVLVGPKLRLESGSLQGADLSGADMTGMVVIGTRTTGIAKAPATLPAGFVAVGPENAIALVGPGALITGADLTGLDISAADLTGTITWDTSGGIKAPAKLPAGAKVITIKGTSGQQLPGLLAGPGVTLQNVPTGADLSSANLTGANLRGVGGSLVLSKANLTNANLGDAIVSAWTLTGATVTGAVLGAVRFSGNPTITGGLVGTPASLPNGVKLVKGYLVGPSLSLAKADLSKADLSGVSLLGADLAGAKLAGANLSLSATVQTIGTPASLPSAGWKLLNGNLFGPYADLSRYAYLVDGDSLAGADLTGTDLTRVNFGNDTVTGPLAAPPLIPLASHVTAGKFMVGPGDNLAKADLSGLNLRNANFSNLDLSGATVDKTVFPVNLSSWVGAKLQGLKGTPVLPSGYVMLGGAVLGQGVDLSGLNLSKVDLAKLKTDSSVRFDNAILAKANLSSVKAAGVSFWGANLSGANLTGGDFTGADMSFTNVDSATLTNADWKDALVEKISSGGVKALPKNFPSGYTISAGYILGPRVKLDNETLSGVDLNGVNLGDASFYNTNLAGAKTCGVKGSPSIDSGWVFTGNADTAGCIVGPNANLNGANLAGANLAGANLFGVSSGGITGSPTLPSGYQLAGGYLFGENVSLAKANLAGITLPNVSYQGVTSGGITGAPGSLPNGVQIIGGFLVANGVDLSGAKLAKLSFKNLSLSGVKFSGADLSGADLSGATFSGNTLFDKANLAGANVAGTDFSGAYVGRKSNNDLCSGAVKGAPKALPSGITLVKGVFTG